MRRRLGVRERVQLLSAREQIVVAAAATTSNVRGVGGRRSEQRRMRLPRLDGCLERGQQVANRVGGAHELDGRALVVAPPTVGLHALEAQQLGV